MKHLVLTLAILTFCAPADAGLFHYRLFRRRSCAEAKVPNQVKPVLPEVTCNGGNCAGAVDRTRNSGLFRGLQ